MGDSTKPPGDVFLTQKENTVVDCFQFSLYLQVVTCRPSGGWRQGAGSSCEEDFHQSDQRD